jgi:hypothetical protein
MIENNEIDEIDKNQLKEELRNEIDYLEMRAKKLFDTQNHIASNIHEGLIYENEMYMRCESELDEIFDKIHVLQKQLDKKMKNH